MNIYNDSFYQNQSPGSQRSAEEILPIIFDIIGRESVCDIGCGLGGWLSTAKILGARRVIGVDGSHVDAGKLMIRKEEFITMDLERRINIDQERFDIALCLEVAEHLSEKRAHTLVEDLIKLSDTVLFSAAIPGQGGVGHINEQWHTYWMDIFSKYGYDCYDVIRKRFWGNPNVAPWYKQNMFLFSCRTDVLANPSARSELVLWNAVHPECWMKMLERKRNVEQRLRFGPTMILYSLWRLIPLSARQNIVRRLRK